MSEESGKHNQQRDMQEFMLRTPTKGSIPTEKRVEDIEETARNRQRAREKVRERMRRADEGNMATSIWSLLENDQTRVVGVKEGGEEP